MTQSLAELEQLCNVLYNSHNPNERQHAEGALRPFSTNAEYIPQCKVRVIFLTRVPTVCLSTTSKGLVEGFVNGA
tara:strand:- start:4939 stop:5163 length:225 start_codon:yes stop_codon:yes gene_type:complete